METKICSKCGKELPLDQFNWRDKTKGTRRSECKICHSNFMKKKYQEKKEVISDLKQQCKCAKCGESRSYLLDYHHLDPAEKESTVARMISNNYSLDKVYSEMKKCIVLCSNCHREFHYFNNNDKNFTIDKYLAPYPNGRECGFDPQ